MTLSHEDVQDILALLDSLPYDDVTLETSRFSLRLRRAGDGVWAQESQLLSEPVPAGPDSQVPVPAPAPAPEQEPQGPAATGPHDGLLEVRAPLLGTFYRAPEPGAAPFVDTGSTVAEDTVVAIIETMKLMNAVHAGVTGTVAEICLADGQFAPQGTVLMRVRPAAG
ncbi:MAG: acetyl-CoA carboxylase biotin carboxyl carrier protein [Gemmatimonadota bacterium]